MPDCWNILECSPKDRERCAAYPFAGYRCWTVDRRECAHSHSHSGEFSDCVECPFFRIMMARKQLGEARSAY